MLNKYFILLIVFSISAFAQIAQVVALKGNVEVLRDSLKSNLLLKDKILENDYISTLKDSRTQILFEDETVITIGENAEFDVRNYLFDNKTNSNTKFNFVKGTFRVITGQIGKINPNNFKLETKSASIGIRGTEIFLELSSDKEEIMCTQGSIEVRIKATDTIIILNKGELVNVDLLTNKLIIKKIDNSTVLSSLYGENSKSERKYDEWISEKKSINYFVNDAFSKKHKVDYTATKLDGSINEKVDGTTTFNLTNANFDLSVDFGKDRNDNPVSGKITVTTETSSSSTKNLTGNIDTSNKINLSYDVKETPSSEYTRGNAVGNLEFKDTALGIQGKNLELRTHSDNELIKINEVEFKAK